MTYSRILLIITFFIIFSACRKDKFDYDPSQPYPELNVGERWDDKYDSRGLQNAKRQGNYLFVNTINISRGKNYLYCLNLVDKKVEWKNEVDFYASQPVCIDGNQIFYVSYVGNIYSFSMEGKKLWAVQPRIDFADYKIDSTSHNLLMRTINNQVFEFDKDSGRLIEQQDEMAADR